jgi:hypothetical protein
MKTLKLIFFVSLLMIADFALAQKVEFTVLGTKGLVKIGESKLKVGSKITTGQSIQISENSYLSLATDDYRVMEITQQGVYTTQQLLSKSPLKQNLNKDYVKFVVAELTKEDDQGITAANRFQHMSKSGAVKRGLGKAIIYVEEVPNQGLYGNSLFLAWHTKSESDNPDSYLVKITDINGKIIAKQNTKNMEISIDISHVNREEISTLKCIVILLDSKGVSLEIADEKTMLQNCLEITLLDEAEKKPIFASIKKYTDMGMVGKLIEGQYFEQKGLYIDAMACYKEAIKLSDNENEYQKYYNKLLTQIIEYAKSKKK